jgi:hypothetical protein
MPNDEPPADHEPAADHSPDEPAWTGAWRVLRYGGEEPSVPTYYAASTESWDVIQADASEAGGSDPHVAPHPIVEVRGPVLVLKDEGAGPDEHERWRVEVDGGQLRVEALDGPHAGAVGIAEPMAADPYEEAAQPPAP